MKLRHPRGKIKHMRKGGGLDEVIPQYTINHPRKGIKSKLVNYNESLFNKNIFSSPVRKGSWFRHSAWEMFVPSGMPLCKLRWYLPQYFNDRGLQ